MHKAFRPVAVMCIVLFLVLVLPARLQAGPLSIRDVAQVIGSGANARQNAQLRINSVSQEGNALSGGATQSAPSGNGGGGGTSSSTTVAPTVSSTTMTTGGDANSSLVTVTAVTTQEGVGGQIETIEFRDVTGTVCDSGEIDHPGFPKWPFLALAGIPFIFLCCDREPPCCDTPQTAIPEPATLLLFGSGLMAVGAGVRRRRRQNQEDAATADVQAAKEV